MYSLAVKEADPKVNWAALVEEKLVRPGAGSSHSTSALLSRVTIRKSRDERRWAQRTVPSLESHARPHSLPPSAPHAQLAGVLARLCGQAGKACDSHSWVTLWHVSATVSSVTPGKGLPLTCLPVK